MFATLQAKLIGAAVALILLAGAVLYVYNKGKEIGQIEGARAQLQTDLQQFEQDRKLFLDELQRYKAKDEAAQQIIKAQDQQLVALRGRRQEARQAIEKLPDSELAKSIRAGIGSAPSDAPFEPLELRKIAGIVSDYPNVVAQNALLDQKIDALAQRVDALNINGTQR